MHVWLLFQEPIVYNKDGDVTIVAVDCGIKNNQIRCLCKRGARVKVVPYNYKLDPKGNKLSLSSLLSAPDLLSYISSASPPIFFVLPIKSSSLIQSSVHRKKLLTDTCKRKFITDSPLKFEVLLGFFVVVTEYDGLFLSNGPGNPEMCADTISHLRSLLSLEASVKPIFGICLGHQLLSLAAGARTYKMKYGD